MELIISLVKWAKAKCHISFLMLRMRDSACTYPVIMTAYDNGMCPGIFMETQLLSVRVAYVTK